MQNLLLKHGLALIEKENYELFNDFCEKGKEIEDGELIENLSKGGFLIDQNLNELNEIKFRLLNGRYSSNSLGLTLAPTSDCNFRCTYCYEKEALKDSFMNEKVQEAIVGLVESRADFITQLSITWYGGEPLMALGIIENLSKRFIEICESKKIEYSAGIITNGYLLDRKKVKLLNELRVNFYQITIDGIKEIHNLRRPLKNGGGTFDVIFNNLKQCIDILPSVSLRVNVDKNNIDTTDEITKLIINNNLDTKVKIYLGKVTNENNDVELGNLCFSTKEFGEKDLEYAMKHSEKIDWFAKYPNLKSNFCGADCKGAFVINSNGLIYKCWNDIGIEDRAVSNILDGKRSNHQIYDEYLLFDPTENSICSECKVLPICMGGCPSARINKQDTCSIYKSSLKEYLLFISEKIIMEHKNKKVDEEQRKLEAI